MKKTILSIAAAALMTLAAVSCATHTTYRSQSYSQQSGQTEGQWQQCAVCGGKGTCASCNGTGRISGDKCVSCNGSGRCRTCDGNGGYTVNY